LTQAQRELDAVPTLAAGLTVTRRAVEPWVDTLRGEILLRDGKAAEGRALLQDVQKRLRAIPGPDAWIQALFRLEGIARVAREAGDWELAAYTADQMIEHDTSYAGSHAAQAAVARTRATPRGRSARWRRRAAPGPRPIPTSAPWPRPPALHRHPGGTHDHAREERHRRHLRRPLRRRHLHRQGTDHPHRAGTERARGHGGGRLRQARDAGRHRRAYPPRHAVRGTTSADDFESGTIAAAHGGTTTVVDFAIQNFGEGLFPAFEGWSKKAEGKAVIDYAFHMIVRELTDQVSGDMDKLTKHEGVTSFKLFMAYPGVFQVDDATIFRALLKTKENGGLVCMHAENGGVIDTLVKDALRKGQTAPKYHALTRPTRAEGEATGRAIALAEMADVPIYIVHLSCSDALEKVKQARDMGLPAYAETCPQYLFLSYEDYERPGFEGAKFVMSPPLREKWNQAALWKGLAKNDLQVVSTDHCPFCMNEPPQKQLGKDDFSKIPNGAPGIETRLMLLWEGVRAG
jgi:hypothetical protein